MDPFSDMHRFVAAAAFATACSIAALRVVLVGIELCRCCNLFCVVGDWPVIESTPSLPADGLVGRKADDRPPGGDASIN